MNIIGLIPARGGSKGIPKKNLLKIKNTPLIGLTIQMAKKTKLINRIIVSTDDHEILKTAQKYGAETPFIRPKDLSTDNAKMIDVLKHAYLFMNEAGEKIDAILLLQPTSPFRKITHLNIRALLKIRL